MILHQPGEGVACREGERGEIEKDRALTFIIAKMLLKTRVTIPDGAGC